MNDASPLPRLHELDWLRTAAIVLVVFFHAGMFFNTWEFHLKTAAPTRALEPLMSWMHFWRMPLLLFISGVGTAFMLRRRNLWQFVGERWMRLFVPLVFGILVIVPPQIWVEKRAAYSSFWEFYPTVFAFRPYPEGNTSWHHLWFILYLFLFGLLALPVFHWFRRSGAEEMKARLAGWLSLRGALAGFILLAVGMEGVLSRWWPRETHALTDDWAAFARYFLFFLAGYLAITLPGVWDALRRDRWLFTAAAVASGAGFILAMKHGLPEVRIGHYDVGRGMLRALVSWTTLLALVAQAQVHLRRPSRLLARWNEASYPVYILHQTVLLLAAAPMVDSTLSWPVQLMILTIVSLGVPILIYEGFLRRFNILRLLFGLKPRGRLTLPRHASGSLAPSVARDLPMA